MRYSQDGPTVAEHQARVRGIIRPRPPLLVPLDAAEGRVLAADVTAVCPLPAFDNSAVDGYAVARADVVTAGPAGPRPCSRYWPIYQRDAVTAGRLTGGPRTGS